MYLIGEAAVEDRQHASQCAACQAKIANLTTPLANFRGAVRSWSDRAVEANLEVIPATGHLERLLVPALEIPWYRSLWANLRDFVTPPPPPLDVTAKPVLVREIWGQYGRQRKSWVMSSVLQTTVVALVVVAGASSTGAPQKVAHFVSLMAPAFAPDDLKPAPMKDTGGGGGGDRSPLPPSKGRLAKPALRQFVPPMAAIENVEARLTMEASIIAPPDVSLPVVNMAQYGDPLARIGPPFNGPGSGGGIGTGTGGGVGPGNGPGYGPGEGGGIGGGVFVAGRGGVSQPSVIFKVEPEYSEEARKAKFQGTVVLYVEIDPGGRAQTIKVAQSLGLGLDEKAIEAVRKWKFKPGYLNGKPVTVSANVFVTFRLL